MRAWLFALGPDEHVLLVVVHHIAADGWSMPLLARDLAAAYAARCAGGAPGWAPLPVQYADYALWQRECSAPRTTRTVLIARQLGYWRGRWPGCPRSWSCPPTGPARRSPATAGDRVGFEVPAELHTQAGRAGPGQPARACSWWCRPRSAVLLTRLGAGTDIPIGSPIAGRTDDALDDLVGFFVNTLVLRTDTSGDPTFRELLGRVRETDLAAYAHQDVPFERLVEVLNPAAVAGPAPAVPGDAQLEQHRTAGGTGHGRRTA